MTNDDLFELKSSLGHDMNRMAREIADQRTKNSELTLAIGGSQARINELVKAMDEVQISIDQDKEELARLEKIIEDDRLFKLDLSKALEVADVHVAELKEKLQTQVSIFAEVTLKYADAHNQRADREAIHNDQLSRLHSDLLTLQTHNKKMAATNRHIHDLLAENSHLQAVANQKHVWTRVRACVTERVRSILHRQKEDEILDRR